MSVGGPGAIGRCSPVAIRKRTWRRWNRSPTRSASSRMRCRASNRGRRAMNKLLTLLCTLLLLAGAPGAAIAVDNGDDVAKTETPASSNLLFILDASGSMWGRVDGEPKIVVRSEEHTSELQSLMRISYAVFCLKKKKEKRRH